MTNLITAIKNVSGEEYFCTTDGNSWTMGNAVPEKFPRSNLSAIVYNNNTGIENLMVVGNMLNPTDTDTITIPWAYIAGQQWASLISESVYTCPRFEDPKLIYYGNSFYISGKGVSDFYQSASGMVWNEVTKRFMLPEAVRGSESDYSMFVGPNNYLWLLQSSPNEVWRGKLNRLDFKVQ